MPDHLRSSLRWQHFIAFVGAGKPRHEVSVSEIKDLHEVQLRFSAAIHRNAPCQGSTTSRLNLMFSPRELDLKSLVLHELVAQKIRADPSLLSKARGWLERMLERSGGAAHPYAAARLAVFDNDLDEALAMATAGTEQALAMRSSCRFPRGCSPEVVGEDGGSQAKPSTQTTSDEQP